jgi:hypothetical protein
MKTKQMAYIIVPHQYHNYTGKGGNRENKGFGSVGNILMIVVPLIVWIILKKIDNEN